jgi:hypothetical protein
MERFRSKRYWVGIAAVLAATIGIVAQVTAAMAEPPSKAEIEKITTNLKTVNSNLSTPNSCPQAGVSVPEAPDPCSDLAALTCKEGEFDDGTWTDTDQDKTYEGIEFKTHEVLKLELEKALFQNSTFRGLALTECLKLEESPCSDCKNTLVDESEPGCDYAIAEGIRNQAFFDIFQKSYKSPFDEKTKGMDLETLAKTIEKTETPLSRDPTYQAIIFKTKTELAAKLKDSEGEAKIRKIFPIIKSLIIQKLERYISDPVTFKNLKDKISAIQFTGTSCGHNLYRSLLYPNAFYDHRNNTFKYCNGFLLGNKSEFKIAHVIAHELGHSIDPCNIAESIQSARQEAKGPDMRYPNPEVQTTWTAQYPLTGLIDCLRSNRSVGARIKDMSKTEPALNPATSTSPGKTGRKWPVLKKPFCGEDQIRESIPDWIATEILPEFIEQRHPELRKEQKRSGYSNVFRTPSCYLPETSYDFDRHPLTRDRINKILLANPKVREQMGCGPLGPETTYCSVKEKDAP